MQTATRISRHDHIDGDCSICLHPLQRQPVAKRLCGHVIHSDCYFDKVLAASRDALINADSCEVCRTEVYSKTRGGEDSTQHFASCKQLVTSSTLAAKAKGGAPQDPSPGPSAFIRVRAKATERKGKGKKTKRLKKRKAGTAFEKPSKQRNDI